MAQPYAQAEKKFDLRNTALAANAAELPHLELKRVRLNELLGEVRSLTAEQASLVARKQEVSKRLAELMQEGNTLVAFLDTGVKQHYGKRAEKLAEFGLQPFRGRSRSQLLGPDGKRKPIPAGTDAGQVATS
jgi:hypothetical protein